MSHLYTMPKTSNPPKGERIAKVMARAGLCSRRDAEKWIQMGRVTVNGQDITSPALNVDPSKDSILVDGERVGTPSKSRVWLYYKPQGLVTSHKDEQERKTVFDTLPHDMPRVISVGRLDLNSEGLLLLTNAGELARYMELPSTGWKRRYKVRINGTPTPEQLESLKDGITVEGIKYGPIEASLERQQGHNAWLNITLREGKNREIRRIMEHFGWRVSRLIRTSYGPFQLGQLKEGDVKEVPQKMVKESFGKILKTK